MIECMDFKIGYSLFRSYCISGSETISNKGVPARFKSIPDCPSKSS
jgi:hypothetical protein